MGQGYAPSGIGCNMPGQMMGPPFVPMMYPQGFGGYPYMHPTTSGHMMHTPGHNGLFNVGTSSSMGGSTPQQSGQVNVNPSNENPTPTRHSAGFRGQPRHLNFMDDSTGNQSVNYANE
ncbi:unnamed protein product [Microthlaspi erraticum]|uniref:Uncharacterized protein n=1 Tax=Microthlaspi erraticum TaxID=1685480 RepID=A0A6D2HLD3_9BRAS|nr:unnamed protein product [Microthlaspi erraticum]